jgi:hypothetical protein
MIRFRHVMISGSRSVRHCTISKTGERPFCVSPLQMITGFQVNTHPTPAKSTLGGLLV